MSNTMVAQAGRSVEGTVSQDPRGPIGNAYAAYDSDPRVNGPDDADAFRDAVRPLLSLDFGVPIYLKASIVGNTAASPVHLNSVYATGITLADLAENTSKSYCWVVDEGSKLWNVMFSTRNIARALGVEAGAITYMLVCYERTCEGHGRNPETNGWTVTGQRDITALKSSGVADALRELLARDVEAVRTGRDLTGVAAAAPSEPTDTDATRAALADLAANGGRDK